MRGTNCSIWPNLCCDSPLRLNHTTKNVPIKIHVFIGCHSIFCDFKRAQCPGYWPTPAPAFSRSRLFRQSGTAWGSGALSYSTSSCMDSPGSTRRSACWHFGESCGSNCRVQWPNTARLSKMPPTRKSYPHRHNTWKLCPTVPGAIGHSCRPSTCISHAWGLGLLDPVSE